MKPEHADALRRQLASDDRADLSTLQTGTDWQLSIGSDVWRLHWNRQITTAVGEDADLHTTCGALLDALAILASRDNSGRDDIDRSTINVLVNRPLPTTTPTETDEALRSLRDATAKVITRVWYRREAGGWIEDTAPAPTWPVGDARIRDWVHRLQLPRLTATPTDFASRLVSAVGDPSLQLYPSEITSSVQTEWALRIDGLQIGIAGTSRAILEIGKAGKNGDGPQRTKFIATFGAPTVHVRDAPTEAHALTIEEAATKIRELLSTFRRADVPGAPISHRAPGGVPIIDEHTLEARLLKGLVHLPGGQLVLDDTTVARGSQFPTLWGSGQRCRPRYLDALLRHDRTPLAIELKVATGGQGRYYRRSLIQAVLYAHFIRNADDLDPWFNGDGLAPSSNGAELDRTAVRASIGVPIPARYSAGFRADLELLRAVAAHVNADVHLLDDRTTPQREDDETARVDRDRLERLSWDLAAHLSARYPKSLGRVVEMHDGGGQYDQLQLQAVNDATITYPSESPRISLNRPGSAWVFNQLGQTRWIWRGIWSRLEGGVDIASAADDLAAVAGLGRPTTTPIDTFATLAARFLQQRPEGGWSWRNAYRGDGDVAGWAATFTDYRRTSAVDGALPPISRLWAALHNGECAIVIDQDNLRVWSRTLRGFEEIVDGCPSERLDLVTKSNTWSGPSGE